MLKGLGKWKILNSKEIKAIRSMITGQWGAELELDCGFLESKDGDIFLISRDIERLDIERLRIDSLGLYFGQMRNDEFRLSIEGSQMVGKIAAKNIIEISDDQLKLWMAGENLETKQESRGYQIIKHNSDFLSCGKYKDGMILNFVPKARRIHTS